jgi:ribosomal protein L11 methyltransferase
MTWLQMSIQTTKANVEAWSDALIAAGAVSITLDEDTQQPIYELSPDHHPLWDRMSLIALFPAEYDSDLLKLRLSNQIDSIVLDQAVWKNIAEEDWLLKWQENLQPMLFGNKLWVCPSWCEIPDPQAINIILDPEMAFGTGTHPTTALCLEWIAENIQPGNTVVDYGCGSGILAIAAAKLGATKVYGIEIDPVALEVSNNNALKNNISSAVFSTYLTDQTPDVQVDVVVANILFNPLLELAPIIAVLLKPNGKIVLSGLLTDQAAAIQACYGQMFKDFVVTHKDEWIRIEANLRSTI